MATALQLQDRKQVRDILSLIADYDEAVAKIAALGPEDLDRAKEAIAALTEREAERVLSGMDVETVNRDRLGIRVASLRSAGIDNMAKLCALSVDEINAVKGIGDEAAYLIFTVAGRIRQEVRTDLKVRLSLDDKSEVASQLLRAVGSSLRFGPSVREAQSLYDAYHETVMEAWQAARPPCELQAPQKGRPLASSFACSVWARADPAPATRIGLK